MKYLLVGLGSDIREDDGIGNFLILLLKNYLKDFDFLILNQLLPEDILYFSEYEKVFIIDADITMMAGEVNLKRVKDIPENNFTYHGVGLKDLLKLGFQLGYIQGEVYIISIGVNSINIGDKLSDPLVKIVTDITEKIVDVIKNC